MAVPVEAGLYIVSAEYQTMSLLSLGPAVTLVVIVAMRA